MDRNRDVDVNDAEVAVGYSETSRAVSVSWCHAVRQVAAPVWRCTQLPVAVIYRYVAMQGCDINR